MEISYKQLHARIGRLATAFAFAFVICGVAGGTAFAADHGHGNHGGGQSHGNSGHAGHRDGGHAVYHRDNYYAPGPNYYSAPEPDYYTTQPNYYPSQPSQGINLFFGF